MKASELLGMLYSYATSEDTLVQERRRRLLEDAPAGLLETTIKRAQMESQTARLEAAQRYATVLELLRYELLRKREG